MELGLLYGKELAKELLITVDTEGLGAKFKSHVQQLGVPKNSCEKLFKNIKEDLERLDITEFDDEDNDTRIIIDSIRGGIECLR